MRRARRVRRIWPIMLTESEIMDAVHLAGGHRSKLREAIEMKRLQGYRAHSGARWLYFTDQVCDWIRETFEQKV